MPLQIIDGSVPKRYYSAKVTTTGSNIILQGVGSRPGLEAGGGFVPLNSNKTITAATLTIEGGSIDSDLHGLFVRADGTFKPSKISGTNPDPATYLHENDPTYRFIGAFKGTTYLSDTTDESGIKCIGEQKIIRKSLASDIVKSSGATGWETIDQIDPVALFETSVRVFLQAAVENDTANTDRNFGVEISQQATQRTVASHQSASGTDQLTNTMLPGFSMDTYYSSSVQICNCLGLYHYVTGTTFTIPGETSLGGKTLQRTVLMVIVDTPVF
jgi:hypothetical protein